VAANQDVELLRHNELDSTIHNSTQNNTNPTLGAHLCYIVCHNLHNNLKYFLILLSIKQTAAKFKQTAAKFLVVLAAALAAVTAAAAAAAAVVIIIVTILTLRLNSLLVYYRFV